MFRKFIGLVCIVILVCALAASIVYLMPSDPAPSAANEGYDVRLIFPSDRYPETAGHIRDAIAKGESAVCTIDRNHAAANRQASLEHIPTKKGYDRDEWPMAMCAEGGDGADIRYVTPSDNRGAGSWIGNELDSYADGTRVLIVVEGGSHADNSAMDAAVMKPSTAGDAEADRGSAGGDSDPAKIRYRSCTDARQAGAAPLHKGDAGYSLKLDRDGDGVACE